MPKKHEENDTKTNNNQIVCHTVIKINILKAIREKRYSMNKGTKLRVAIDFQSEIM